MRTVYPDLYAEMSEKILDRYAQTRAAGRDLPGPQKVQLTVLLGLPIERLDPDLIRMRWQGYGSGQAEHEGPSQAPSSQGHEAPDIASGFRTESERLEGSA